MMSVSPDAGHHGRVVDVAAQQPERGPEAVADRQLHPGADPAVGEVQLGVGVDPPGGEVVGPAPGLGAALAVLGLREKAPVLGADVVGVVDVRPRLPVHRTHLLSGSDDAPLGAVETRARDVVEERRPVRARLFPGQGGIRGGGAASRAPDLELVEGVAELGGRGRGVAEGPAFLAERRRRPPSPGRPGRCAAWHPGRHGSRRRPRTGSTSGSRRRRRRRDPAWCRGSRCPRRSARRGSRCRRSRRPPG